MIIEFRLFAEKNYRRKTLISKGLSTLQGFEAGYRAA